MAHWEMGNQELPNDFRLTGAGLESELPAFVEHITNINPAMAKVFLKHLSILKEASTEEARRAARASFNSSAKADLLARLAESKEREVSLATS